MPGGVPVATVALNGAKNAGLLAAQIIGSGNQEMLNKMVAYKEGLRLKVTDSAEQLRKKG
jgi:5-(carboxyamino)imidazole ribonucleotide mutase